MIDDGIFILTNEEHSENAYSSIDMTESGMFISLNEIHLANA